MTTDLALLAPSTGTWQIHGRARIDDRPAVRATLTIRADGTWLAELSTFTLVGQVDLFFVASDGGHFCGPASVERSRADSHPYVMLTALRGVGPLLVVAPNDQLELPDAEMVDGEVVN